MTADSALSLICTCCTYEKLKGSLDTSEAHMVLSSAEGAEEGMTGVPVVLYAGEAISSAELIKSNLADVQVVFKCTFGVTA